MNPRSTALSLIVCLAAFSTQVAANQPQFYMTSDGQVLAADDPRLAGYQIVNNPVDANARGRGFEPSVPQPRYTPPEPQVNRQVQEAPEPQVPREPPPPQPTQAELNEMLFEAAKAGNTGRVRALVERGANPMSGTKGGETALHAAASRGQLGPIIYLAHHGGNVNALTVKGWSPLHHAARFGHKRAVEYLLRMGSIPHLRTSDLGRKSPMEMAVDNKYFEIAMLFGYRPRPGEF